MGTVYVPEGRRVSEGDINKPTLQGVTGVGEGGQMGLGLGNWEVASAVL